MNTYTPVEDERQDEQLKYNIHSAYLLARSGGGVLAKGRPG